MSVAVEEIDRQVDERLKKLARDVRMPGFRPGKVPLKLVAQTYGRSALGSARRRRAKGFHRGREGSQPAASPAIRASKKKAAADDKALEFSATFESIRR